MDPLEEDTDDIRDQKAKIKEQMLAFFDFYVDKMLPTCAGNKMWHPKIRHYECVSESKLSNGHVRITYGDEALCALLYKNAREKWIAGFKYLDENKHTPKNQLKVPKWNNKKPEENQDFKALYSDPYAGQNKLGGWNREGRKYFGQMARICKETRENRKERCAEVERACQQRLYEQNKDRYDKENEKKRKHSDETDENLEEDPDLEWYM